MAHKLHLVSYAITLLGALDAVIGRSECSARCADNANRYAELGVESYEPAWSSVPLEAGHTPPPLEQIGDHTFLVHDLLTPAESAAIIAAAERAGSFEDERINFGWGRVSHRDVLRFEDGALTSTLARRLQTVLPDIVGKNGTRHEGVVWRPAGLNTAMRMARYRPGDQLPTHNDHVTYAGPRCCSVRPALNVPAPNYSCRVCCKARRVPIRWR